MIFINGRFVMQRSTGVQRFASEITAGLAQIRDDITVVAPPGVVMNSIENTQLVQFGRLEGHLWEQIELPKYLRSCFGRPLLLSLTNSGPITYPNQIATQHDLIHAKYPKGFSVGYRLAYAIIGPNLATHARRLITVSDASRNELARHYRVSPEKYTVAPNAASTYFTRRSSTRSIVGGAGYFLAFWSHGQNKNIPRLLSAFRRIRNELDPTVRLVLVGGRSERFPDNVSGLPGVEYLGRVTDDELQRLYANAIALVFPSIYEGFGIPPLEAQRVGCVVLASRISPLTEVLQDSAMYFDPTDDTSILDCMKVALHDDARVAELVAAGFTNEARYSWIKSAMLVSELIDTVLTSGTG